MPHLRFCRTNVRLYRVSKLQTLWLSSCMLQLFRINKHSFCATFSVSLSSFTNTVPKWWNCSISNLFWTLRLITCFVLQDSLLKLYYQEYRNQSCRFGLFTRQRYHTWNFVLQPSHLTISKIKHLLRKSEEGLPEWYLIWSIYHTRRD